MRRLLVALVLLAAAPCLTGVTLTVLHTSDLHGRVHPHDALADRDLGEGLARVATAVRGIRAEGRPTLLLDSGDTIQGAPTQALVFAGKIPSAGDPIVRAMNLLGYDAMAIGNHDFDFGLERLEKSRREARFPWLSANTLGRDGSPAFAPYTVREVAGVRVGILGLVTPHVGSWVSPALLGSLSFGDSLAAARKYVPILRGTERCDLVVVITHQGFERDPETGEDQGGGGENQAYALATQVPGIDLLLTGHTHTVIAPRRLGGAWISQPGRWGNTLTRFDVTLAEAGGRWKVTDIQGQNLPMKRVVPDAEIVGVIEAEHQATMKLLAEKVAELEVPVSAREIRGRDSGLLDWLHAVQMREGNADLSFCSLLPATLADWEAGPLTLRQVWAFYPYENSLVVVQATGRQIREALERSAGCFGDPKILGRNCDTLEGAEYAIDPAQPRGHRVVALQRNGRALRDDETFTVALNSYRASGGGGYFMWKGRPRLRETGNVRDLLVANARARGRLRPEPSGNWRVTPAAPPTASGP